MTSHATNQRGGAAALTSQATNQRGRVHVEMILTRQRESCVIMYLLYTRFILTHVIPLLGAAKFNFSLAFGGRGRERHRETKAFGVFWPAHIEGASTLAV